jgi:hypothetical protein
MEGTFTLKLDLGLVAFVTERKYKPVLALGRLVEQPPFKVDLFAWDLIPEQFVQ